MTDTIEQMYVDCINCSKLRKMRELDNKESIYFCHARGSIARLSCLSSYYLCPYFDWKSELIRLKNELSSAEWDLYVFLRKMRYGVIILSLPQTYVGAIGSLLDRDLVKVTSSWIKTTSSKNKYGFSKKKHKIVSVKEL